MAETIYGIARDEAQAERAVQELNRQGFAYQDISFLRSDTRSGGSMVSGNAMENRNWRTEERVTDMPMGTTRTEYVADRPVSGSQGGLGHEKHSKAPEGATTGATAGGIIGGTLGLLAGIGALAIPGLGPFIAAGPIMATLAGLGAGGATGGLIGALVGAGIPEFEAKHYENRLKEGGILLAVHVPSDEAGKRAKEVLERVGLEEISRSSSASTSKKYNK
jgi:hypothetical protein